MPEEINSSGRKSFLGNVLTILEYCVFKSRLHFQRPFVCSVVHFLFVSQSAPLFTEEVFHSVTLSHSSVEMCKTIVKNQNKICKYVMKCS